MAKKTGDECEFPLTLELRLTVIEIIITEQNVKVINTGGTISLALFLD